MARSGELRAAGELSGSKVRNRSGEDLGSIEDFMLDMETGRVAYAVMSSGGALGFGSKLFAVPVEALQVDERGETFLLDIDKEALKEAPGFDREDWPDFADPALTAQIHSYYERRPRP